MVLYLRIFHPSRRATIMIWIGIIFNCVFYIAYAYDSHFLDLFHPTLLTAFI